jgi:hypothetical protein
MIKNLRNLFYGTTSIKNVSFINKLTPNFFVYSVKFVSFIVKKIYYALSPKQRLKVFKKILNLDDSLYKIPNFDTVYFELRTRCNSQCTFCMASILTDNRKDIQMDIELFKKIIDELSEKNFSGTIGFYVNNEPLLVKNLDEYIVYARKKLINANLRILTNGLKLNPKLGLILLECGIDEIEVNLYLRKKSDMIPRGIEKFENEIIMPLVKNQKVKADNKFNYNNRTIHYYKVLRNIGETLTSRGGTAPNWQSKNLTYDGYCSYPFWQLNITADGRIAQCCADFYFDNTELNCKQKNIYEIWNSEFFHNLRSDLLNGDRSNNKLCSECDFCGENPRRAKSFIGKAFVGFIS